MKKIYSLFLVCLTMFILCSCDFEASDPIITDGYTQEEVINILSNYYSIDEINSFFSTYDKKLNKNYHLRIACSVPVCRLRF